VSFYDQYILREKPLPLDDRIDRVLRALPAEIGRLLDIGCGPGRNLEAIHRVRPGADLHGIDIGRGVEGVLQELGFTGHQCDASEKIPYPDAFFDAVVCGEVIEHVVDTDNLLREVRRVLIPGGTLIITTPNLAYAVNRIMLLFGLQPFFSETSMQCNLGRRFSFLGQGNEVQGHLRIFTLPALLDILRLNGFQVQSTTGYRWIQKGIAGKIDAVLRLKPSLAAGFVISAKPVESIRA
jgi:SAM-dependent methyltransferase